MHEKENLEPMSLIGGLCLTTKLRMIVAGGGTGGHFFPAQAIRKALQNKGIEVKYIGSKFGVESTHCSPNNNDELLLNIRGLQRHISVDSIIRNILFPFRFLQSYIQSWMLLHSFKPHVVIGTGGYSSGLPLLAAIHKGIKTIIQEQNSFPGITTRHLASRVDGICIAYQEATTYLKNNLIFTGNPIREDIQVINKSKAKERFNCHDSQPVLAVLGGSQGSIALNRHFQQQYKTYTALGIQILWQCGKNDYTKLKKTINEENVHLVPFSDDMGAMYSAAELIISRAGALALSEMALMGKAMVLVPFPYSAGDHQVKNAKVFSDSGAAILLPQSKLKSGALEATVIELFRQPKKIRKMEAYSTHMATPNAIENIISTIMDIAKN